MTKSVRHKGHNYYSRIQTRIQFMSRMTHHKNHKNSHYFNKLLGSTVTVLAVIAYLTSDTTLKVGGAISTVYWNSPVREVTVSVWKSDHPSVIEEDAQRHETKQVIVTYGSNTPWVVIQAMEAAKIVCKGEPANHQRSQAACGSPQIINKVKRHAQERNQEVSQWL